MFAKIISMLLQHEEKDYTISSAEQIIYYSEPRKAFIDAKQITGILDIDKPCFWNHKGNTMEVYLQLAKKSDILYKKWCQGTPISELQEDPDCKDKDIAQAYLNELQMVQVYKKSCNEYKLVDDGRHRVAAAQNLGIYILVKILGEYKT